MSGDGRFLPLALQGCFCVARSRYKVALAFADLLPKLSAHAINKVAAD